MTNNDISGGLDFTPQLKPSKKAISVTISEQAKGFLEHLQRHYSLNVSLFINNLLLMIKEQKNIEPIEYAYKGSKYRECRFLLRKEVADYIENWEIYGSFCLSGTKTEKFSPMQIAEKISHVLASNESFCDGDAHIYGCSDVIEARIKRLGEKAKEHDANP